MTEKNHIKTVDELTFTDDGMLKIRLLMWNVSHTRKIILVNEPVITRA